MDRVSVKEEEGHLNRGRRITFVDSRAPDVWSRADVKAGGAIRIAPDEAEKHIADVSRDDYLVTYCT
jgi:hypothetical protein